MIEISNIHVTFGKGTPLENRAIQGISLRIPKGEFVTVIGSNGAGKSTLLNVLAGDTLCDCGRIRFGDKDCTRQVTHRRATRVARVFQDPKAGTCENLTIAENMSLANKRGQSRWLRGAHRQSDIELFRERLAHLDLGLENRLDDQMGLLSGGQRQAVSLVMATLQPSDILLLDEHTAALDPKTAGFVMNLTEQIIAEQNLTALMVTHSMKQALDVGSRTLMLHEGKIAFDVANPERKNLGVNDLLRLFEETKGEELTDDNLLLE
ncbi:MAG: ABC transporter ATP-binding protein [Proteobacteria bacterium]|nr:MAG: ABC transporter ATP-binding protein [Pseudomonadota bacterium]